MWKPTIGYVWYDKIWAHLSTIAILEIYMYNGMHNSPKVIHKVRICSQKKTINIDYFGNHSTTTFSGSAEIILFFKCQNFRKLRSFLADF